MSGELTLDAACAEHGLTLSEVEHWLREFRRLALLEFDAELERRLMSQGASGAAHPGAVFTGTLDDISVADMIQSLQIAGKDAVITVSAGGLEHRIWCARGAVVDAESGALVGEAALYRILAYDHGQMIADLRAAPHASRISEPTHRLLLEALRRKDEIAKLESELGDPNLPFQTHGVAAPDPELSPHEQAVLTSFHEPRSLRDVMAGSQLGDWETATALASLIRRGRLQRVEGAAAREPSPLSAPERPSALSFLPLAAAEPPQRRSGARGVLLVSLALALVPVAFWMGEKASAAYPPGAPAAIQASARHDGADGRECAALAPTSYTVTLTVEPAHAELWLDGENVGRGSLSRPLPRDGAGHELRAVADGFVPVQLWFADIAPPAKLQLSPLPSAIASAAAPTERAPAAPGETRATSKRKASTRKASRSGAPAPRAEDDATASIANASAVRSVPTDAERASPPRAADGPRIQLIE